MSVYTEAILMVGLSVKELGISEDDFWNDIEPQGFIRTQPWYDCSWNYSFIGIPLIQSSNNKVLTSWPDTTDSVSHFEKVLGKKPQVLLTLNID